MKNIIYLFLVIGLFLSAVFYTFVVYYSRYSTINKIKFSYIFPIALFLGLIAFAIKIPTIYYFGKEVNVYFINLVYITSIFICAIIYSKFFLNEKIEIHTYFVTFLIILLLILNMLLYYKKN